MNSYLREVKREVKCGRKPTWVVLGNESVDLDSAVSAVSLAFHLHKVKTASSIIPSAKHCTGAQVVPVINAPRVELPLKTEVTYWLKRNNIELENLLCRDEIDLKEDVESFILVDHHVSEYREKVISVLDHRPFDPISNLNNDCFTNIQEVGSCATLVCDTIKQDCLEDPIEPVGLCYAAIVLDTINFSQEADKVRPLDISTADYVEKLLCMENVIESRKVLFDELVAARADVSSLDSLQLLSKDLKIVSNASGTVRVAIPGVDVFNYILMPNAEENVKIFSAKNHIDVVVLMGMRPKGDSVERFLGFIDIKNPDLYSKVS